MDVAAHNSLAWDREVERGVEWTRPVSAEAVARARLDDWSIVLTPKRPVPRGWFPPLVGARVLGLAAAGGQQGPILAAAGAHVTVFDNSPRQLEQDRFVAVRDGLEIATELGDMRDLGRFADASFDLIVNPCSTCFVEELAPVWRECHRVLRPGGRLMTGFLNPAWYVFDHDHEAVTGELSVRYRLPYADTEQLPPAALQRRIAGREPLEFSHTLTAQIGGQLAAGFELLDLYEDGWSDAATRLNAHMPLLVATLARKITRPTHAI